MSEILLLLHGAMNMFGSGRSMARMLLFIGIFCVALFTSKAQRGNGPRRFGEAGAALAIALVIGASMQVWFSDKIGVSPFEYALVVAGPEVTSSSLLHNHFGKAAFGDVARILQPEGYEKLDPGSAIASVTPFAFKVAFLASLITFLVLTLVSYRASLPEKRRLSYALGFSAIAFVALKTAVDGGFLAEHGILSIGLMFALSARSANVFWKTAILVLLAQFAWYSTAQVLNLYSSSEEAWLLHALSSLGVWCFASYFISRSAFPETEARLTKICAFGWTAILGVSVLSQLQLVSYRMLDARDALIATYVEHSDPAYTLIRKTGDLFTYRYSGADTVGELIDENAALDNTYPVSVPWKTCLPTGPRKEISFIERDFETGSSTPRSLFMDACQPRPVSFAQESVKANGEVVILTDIRGL